MYFCGSAGLLTDNVYGHVKDLILKLVQVLWRDFLSMLLVKVFVYNLLYFRKTPFEWMDLSNNRKRRTV